MKEGTPPTGVAGLSCCLNIAASHLSGQLGSPLPARNSELQCYTFKMTGLRHFQKLLMNKPNWDYKFLLKVVFFLLLKGNWYNQRGQPQDWSEQGCDWSSANRSAQPKRLHRSEFPHVTTMGVALPPTASAGSRETTGTCPQCLPADGACVPVCSLALGTRGRWSSQHRCFRTSLGWSLPRSPPPRLSCSVRSS